MEMRNVVLMLLMASFFASFSFAANITLGYSECRTSGNDTFCAPPDRTLNETELYKACIADAKAFYNLTPIRDEITNNNANISELISTFRDAASSNFTETMVLLKDIKNSANLTFVNSYIQCSLENAQLKNATVFQTSEIERLTKEKFSLENNMSTLVATQTAVLSEQLKKANEEKTGNSVLYFIAGIIALYAYKEISKPKGREMTEETSPKIF